MICLFSRLWRSFSFLLGLPSSKAVIISFGKVIPMLFPIFIGVLRYSFLSCSDSSLWMAFMASFSVNIFCLHFGHCCASRVIPLYGMCVFFMGVWQFMQVDIFYSLPFSMITVRIRHAMCFSNSFSWHRT